MCELGGIPMSAGVCPFVAQLLPMSVTVYYLSWVSHSCTHTHTHIIQFCANRCVCLLQEPYIQYYCGILCVVTNGFPLTAVSHFLLVPVMIRSGLFDSELCSPVMHRWIMSVDRQHEADFANLDCALAWLKHPWLLPVSIVDGSCSPSGIFQWTRDLWVWAPINRAPSPDGFCCFILHECSLNKTFVVEEDLN